MKSTESQAEIQQQAQEIWDGAAAAPDQHPFFACWGVSVNGLKIYRGDLSIDGVRCDGMLLVPMRDAERNLQNLAFLGLTERHYLSNDHVLNSYFGFGQRSDRILVAKGFLQGARAHRAFGHAVVVAFTAENVPNVMQIMRKRYTDARIVLVAPDGSIQDADGEREDVVANVNVHTGERSDDSAAAPGLGDAGAAEECSGAPEAATERLEDSPQAPAPCGANDAIVLLEPESEDAQLLLSWIRRKKLTELTRRQVMQFGPNSIRYAPIAKLALRRLVRSGWLSTEDDFRFVLTPAASVAISEERQRSA